MERSSKRSLSESSDDTDVGFKIPKKQFDSTTSQQQQQQQQQHHHQQQHRNFQTFNRRESQTSTISSASATSVSEDDELDGQQLSQVSFVCF